MGWERETGARSGAMVQTDVRHTEPVAGACEEKQQRRRDKSQEEPSTECGGYEIPGSPHSGQSA